MSRLVVRSENVVLPDFSEPQKATLFIREGLIEKIELGASPLKGEWTSDQKISIIDVGSQVVMPGLVDTHAHINEPGRTEWEGFKTATQAAAAGGITTVVDMPLNSIPATTSLKALQEKAKSAQGNCQIDYGFWGGVIPGNSNELSSMIGAGVRGFKCFLIESGVSEFPHVKEEDLRLSMPILGKAGIPLLVHAELEISSHSSPKNTYQSYLESRPAQWEVEAIRKMISLSRQTDCPVHIVHLSAADALDDIKEARNAGVKITVETCPHYLTFTSEEIINGATHFKCAPPIREKHNRERLWDGLKTGLIDFIVSDHSPCTPSLKKLEQGDFNQAWGGISGIQFSLLAIWTQMRSRGLSLSQIAEWMSSRTALFAGLDSKKGALKEGNDADFLIFDPDYSFQLKSDQIYHRHKITPYVDRKFYGKVNATYLRGEKIYSEGGIFSSAKGLWQKGNSKWTK